MEDDQYRYSGDGPVPRDAADLAALELGHLLTPHTTLELPGTQRPALQMCTAFS